jgi:hypothetical protein
MVPAEHVPGCGTVVVAVGDLVFFAGAGLGAAYGLRAGRRWAVPMFYLHTGAACYASLYTLQQSVMTNEAWLSAGAMFPSLILLPVACITFRPGSN